MKEGRGDGSGAQYRPWLTVQDVSSLGRSSRIHSRKTGREHHLLSDIETAVFMLLDWSDAVIDIREQFPLERDETRRIAVDMAVRHPIDSQSRIEIVMTTDFLIDVQLSTGTKIVVRSVKPSTELDNKRTLEKLEIDRRYWEARGVDDWGLITNQDLPAQRIKNLRWLHEMQSLENMASPHPNYWEDRSNQFLACLSQATDLSIRQFMHYLENAQGFAMGEGLTVLRHLAANKIVAFDLDAKFEINSSINVLTIAATPSKSKTRRTHSAVA
jgi:TnsA endonuclease N terminal/TnsA endonuclease C terminal